MNIERIFNDLTDITFEEIIQSLVEEKIDSLIEEYYYQDKVNTATSHKEGNGMSTLN